MEIETFIETKCEQLLLKAIHFGASDLHILPSEKNYTIMFRKYGQLIFADEFPYELAGRMISYYKFLSSLDISERRKPQSGAFHQVVEQDSFAFRVSTLPSSFAKESIVIRILLQHASIPLETLCFTPNKALELYNLVEKRQGLLLFTGATGSGKTTTMYSLMQHCSSELNRHVISLEDPVESYQKQVLQIQVNEKAGVTYSSGLKAILRHSPDIIMIGEIRDQETAQIAVEAALTGHLVVSTIHAKDSVNCLYRLMDLGISIEDLRQTLVGIVAQTLVKIPQEEGRKAIFEILQNSILETAIQSTQQQKSFSMPVNETLQEQMKSFDDMPYARS